MNGLPHSQIQRRQRIEVPWRLFILVFYSIPQPPSHGLSQRHSPNRLCTRCNRCPRRLPTLRSLCNHSGHTEVIRPSLSPLGYHITSLGPPPPSCRWWRHMASVFLVPPTPRPVLPGDATDESRLLPQAAGDFTGERSGPDPPV